MTERQSFGYVLNWQLGERKAKETLNPIVLDCPLGEFVVWTPNGQCKTHWKSSQWVRLKSQ